VKPRAPEPAQQHDAPTPPPARAAEPAPQQSAWPGLILLVLLLGGAGGGYLYFTAGEPALLSTAPEPTPAASPAHTTPHNAGQPPAAPVTEHAGPAAPEKSDSLPEPVAEPVLEPEPEAVPTTPPVQPAGDPDAPPYRASIEHDAEGITLILEEPVTPLPAQTAPAPELPPLLAENPLANRGDTPDRAAPEAAPTVPEPAPAKPQKREIVHIVERGDTLWDIARRYVDNPWRYPELAENSEIRDPDLIYPGDRVRIIIYRGRRP
jgi:hypothetical protein